MTSFSSNITNLRKKKGISQKMAANELGISQALLSHYENGIRECGLDFVVKVAQYYSVSCDYLLGYSNTSVSLATMEKISDIEEDEKLSTNTVFRASAMLGSKYAKNKQNSHIVNDIYAIRTYTLIAQGIEKGFVPKSWIGNAVPSKLQIEFLNCMADMLFEDLKKNVDSIKDDDVPTCIKTITSTVNNMLNESLAELVV